MVADTLRESALRQWIVAEALLLHATPGIHWVDGFRYALPILL
jgi:hypothetical protein